MQTSRKLGSLLISRKELLELKEAEESYAIASKALTETENAVKPLRLAFAEKVLGIKTAEELKTMEPDEVCRVMLRRLGAGKWETMRGAPRFSFVKTSAGRYPAWKQEFISVAGEVAAEKITANTPQIYSYRVEVA